MLALDLPISPALQYWIKSIIYLEGKSLAQSYQLVPRIYAALIFVAPSSESVNFTLKGKDNFLQKDQVYISGVGNIPCDFQLNGEVKFLVVIFKPYTTSVFLRDRANLVTNLIISGSEISSKLKFLNEKIWGTTSALPQKVILIEQFLNRYLDKKNIPDGTLRAYHQLNIHQGCLSIKEVASRSFMSNRNMLRNFTEYIGISPKQYASMLRFNSFIKEYTTMPFINTEELLFKYGYYDYSHLNKDFIKFMEAPPSLIIPKDHSINQLIL